MITFGTLKAIFNYGSKKIDLLEKERIILTDAAMRFQLDQLIATAERKLQQLRKCPSSSMLRLAPQSTIPFAFGFWRDAPQSFLKAVAL